MPIIPALNANTYADGKIVDADTVYTESLYKPTATMFATNKRTFELLNGGLTSSNFGGADNTLKAHQIEMGSMARAYYHGFNRTDFVYADQMINNVADVQTGISRSTARIVHSELSVNIFLPWDTKLVTYGYQAMFNHDAPQCDESTGGGSSGLAGQEYWDLELQIGRKLDASTLSTATSNPSYALYHQLPHNRYADEDDGTTEHSGDSFSPVADEGTFKFVSKTGMLAGSDAPSKGYVEVRLTVGCNIINNDPRKTKLKTPSGGIWILALR